MKHILSGLSKFDKRMQDIMYSKAPNTLIEYSSDNIEIQRSLLSDDSRLLRVLQRCMGGAASSIYKAKQVVELYILNKKFPSQYSKDETEKKLGQFISRMRKAKKGTYKSGMILYPEVEVILNEIGALEE